MDIRRGVDAIYLDLIAAHKRHLTAPGKPTMREVRRLHSELAQIVGRGRTYRLSVAAIREARQHVRDEVRGNGRV